MVRLILTGVLACMVLSGCSTTQSNAKCAQQPDPMAPKVMTKNTTTANHTLPAAGAKVLLHTEASKLKVYMDAQGNITKYAAYVPEGKLPRWFVELADKTIGKGDNAYGEVEYYVSSKLDVYEVTRTIDGKRVEFAARADTGAIHYIERDIDPATLPQPVLDALKNMGAATLTAARTKVVGKNTSYEAHYTSGTVPHRVYLDAAGKVTRHIRIMPAAVAIEVK